MLTLLLSFVLIYSTQAVLRCDFETFCIDFIPDNNWGLTNGLNPHPIDHDHTLNTSTGHYLFYQPQTNSQYKKSEIKTNDWLEPSTDRAVCFTMWYFTPLVSMPFTIQLVQGDDEQLKRIIAEIPGKDPSINDWTRVNVVLPVERIKLFIRLNSTDGSLAIDDLSIDFCDGPRPPIPKILFACDFESSCSDNFMSLSNYPYSWWIMRAGEAATRPGSAPSTDFTYHNTSGHYAWMDLWTKSRTGRVGYLTTRQAFDIRANESYCLSVQYFSYGQENTANLRVYTWMHDSPNTVQAIWPIDTQKPYL